MSDTVAVRIAYTIADAECVAVAVTIADMRTERMERGLTISGADLAVCIRTNRDALLCLRRSVERQPRE